MKHEYDPNYNNKEAAAHIGAEYYIRWRAKRDEDGEVIRDNQGKPVL